MITIYFDGLCEPRNPGGVATYGFIIERDGVALHKRGEAIGEGYGMTNNVAEYTGLLKALEWLRDNHIEENEITIKGDSKLVINQVKGIWQVKSETSRRFVPLITDMLKGKTVHLSWIPREQNEATDRLSRIAYELYRRNEKSVKITVSQKKLPV